MKPFVVYDAAGKILRTGIAPDISIQPLDGEFVIEGEADLMNDRVVDGVIVKKDAVEIEAQEIAFAWKRLRSRRTQLLASCDWTQVPDAPVDHAAWAIYRQALRDLPANTEDPRNPQWPTPPQ
jgi:hypothetical protein